MILTIGIVLLVIWLIVFTVMRKVVGGFIHLLLVIAVIAICWHFIGPMIR